MAESKVVLSRPNSASPEPTCAICLGGFTNKCFSDSCMHQFCFKCLLEWSKIKAECPLCKQPFKSIIHNVKSNDEYDEHVVENIPSEDIIIDEQYLFLPQPTRHQFHFRTTFTVDTRGEHAIQQMLLTHPLTNGGISIAHPSHNRTMLQRRRRDTSATSFRRSIYTRNLWVSAPPDVTGRYRDVTPPFFRTSPGARTRLVPWLNRELNALLYENTQLIMHLVDIILEQLLSHHICSRTFRSILCEYLASKTDHFVHEFYNFMRSPFDMIGYDRHIIYAERPTSPAPFIDISDNDTDSDVILVSATNPEEPVVIDLINTDSDEPILVSEHPAPSVQQQVERGSDNETRAPILPLKLRLKHKRQSREKRLRTKRRQRHRSTSNSSTSTSTTTSSDSSDLDYRKHKRRRKLKKRSKPYISSDSGNNVCDLNSTDSENVPLSSLGKKRHKKHSRRKHMLKNPKSYTILNSKDRQNCERNLADLPSCSRISPSYPEDAINMPTCSRYDYSPMTIENSHAKHLQLPLVDVPGPSQLPFPDAQPSTSNLPNLNLKKKVFDDSDSDSNSASYRPMPLVKSEVHEVHRDDEDDQNGGRLRKFFIKKEKSSNMWYSYPSVHKSESSDY